jgi:hypothetical protein
MSHMKFRHNSVGRRNRINEIVPLSNSITARITLLDGSITGLREIDSFGSILQVRAAPFAELDKMKATITGSFIAYVIDAPRVYTGHGRDSRNVGDRIDKTARQTSQVYIIFSADPRFDKPAAAYVEARLIDTAAELAVPLANGVRPFGIDGLTRSPDLEQLVAHAMFLLAIAGFRRFEDAQQTGSGRPVHVTATGDLHDVLVIEPDAITIPDDAVRHHLVCRNLRAEGFAIGKRFLVLPSADYCYEAKSGLSTHNQWRREAIEAMGILDPLPDFVDRAKLRVGLDCKSPSIAAKILTGEHIGTRAWQAAPSPDARITPSARL